MLPGLLDFFPIDYRMGDTVLVPIRRTFTRIGISDPVTKTVFTCSS